MLTQGFVIGLIKDALLHVILTAAPMLGLGLIVGLGISIVQTATSIQDQTLSFVPKLIAILLAVALFGSWMLRMLMDYMIKLLMMIPDLAVIK
ncbi:flagellar biosynthesis protein FliQ [bacterium]|nr:flagellar biosynthesis protein FliQ [bacterium]MBU1615788.1 flagellar biosynthesis protein FliQ [bacterium]